MSVAEDHSELGSRVETVSELGMRLIDLILSDSDKNAAERAARRQRYCASLSHVIQSLTSMAHSAEDYASIMSIVNEMYLAEDTKSVKFEDHEVTAPVKTVSSASLNTL